MYLQQPFHNIRQNKPKNYNFAYFNSTPKILSWASNLLDLEITNIDQMVTGAIFCQLLDACHPDSVQMNNINWRANCEKEYHANFKIFQQGLNKNNIDKTIDINRLVKGKRSELNELLQWIYNHYINDKEKYNEVYNAKMKRNGQNLVFKQNIRPKFINDNYTQQSSFSRNNSEGSDINNRKDYDSSCNYNVDKINFNLSRSKSKIICHNNLHNRYNMNNIFFKNRFLWNFRIRNKSKDDIKNKRYNEFEEKVLNNNNHSNDLNDRNNYLINNNNNNNYTTINRSYSKNWNNNINNKNIISNNSFKYSNFNNKIHLSNEEESSKIIIDDETGENKNNDRNDDNNEKEIDINDFYELNSDDLKYLAEKEKNDGNKEKDLKIIIRKLRIQIISKDKEINRLNKILNNINKLTNFYLNKLKDIEYLFFNPIIKNTNKIFILRKILSSDEDTTIYIDENNKAFLPNEINNKQNRYYFKKKWQPLTLKKNIINENDMNNIYNDKKININNKIDHIYNKNIQSLNYNTAKKNNMNYINYKFDSFDNNENMNISNLYNNNINTNNNNNTNNTTQMIKESQTDTFNNFNNSNYEYDNVIKSRTKKIIPIKLCTKDGNIILYPNNLNNNISSCDTTYNNIK